MMRFGKVAGTTVRDRQPKLQPEPPTNAARGANRGHEQIAKPQKEARQDQRARKESLTGPDPTRVAEHPQARIPNRHDSSTEEFGAYHADVISTPHDSMRHRDHGNPFSRSKTSRER